MTTLKEWKELVSLRKKATKMAMMRKRTMKMNWMMRVEKWKVMRI